jgi:hypothetical protein
MYLYLDPMSSPPPQYSPVHHRSALLYVHMAARTINRFVFLKQTKLLLNLEFSITKKPGKIASRSPGSPDL